MNNPGFSIGPVHVYYYGLILGVAILVGYLFARKRVARYQVPVEFLDLALILMVPLAILGARLYFVAFSWATYKDHWQQIFQIQGGGLAIHGALIGGALGLWIALIIHKNKSPRPRTGMLARVLDVVAPVLPLSQAIGRIANYVNHEAFGRPTNLPFGIYIPPEKRPAQYIFETHFHPTFAYEALWNLLGVVIIVLAERNIFSKKRASHGVLFALYLGWYSIGRFWIESLRTDALLAGHLRIAQIVSVVALLGSSAYIWYRTRRWRRQKSTKEEAPSA